MRINWKVRFKNKTWLWCFASAIIGFAYGILNACGVIPKISQSTLLNIVYQIISVLALMGVIIDPTTQGLDDSKRAMGYNDPYPTSSDEGEGGNG